MLPQHSGDMIEQTAFLQYPDVVCHARHQRAAAAALSDENGCDGHAQRGHLHQIFRNGLALTALLGHDAAERTGGIHKADHGPAEFFRLFHQARRLVVTLRVGHAEIVPGALFGRVALFHGDDRDGFYFQQGDAAHHGRIVGKAAVSVQLYKALPKCGRYSPNRSADRLRGRFLHCISPAIHWRILHCAL